MAVQSTTYINEIWRILWANLESTCGRLVFFSGAQPRVTTWPDHSVPFGTPQLSKWAWTRLTLQVWQTSTKVSKQVGGHLVEARVGTAAKFWKYWQVWQ